MNGVATTDPVTSGNDLVIRMRGVASSSHKDAGEVVVEHVDWTVAPGEFWVVGAPQHSGKSDFLMMTGGLTAPRSGEYDFLGRPMPIFDEAHIPHRLKLGFVFDGGQLLGGLTVAENIALPLRYHRGLDEDELLAQVERLLELTDLVAMANQPPGRIGRAWQQRAGLARALALQPEVLLVDSPLTGLDVRHTNWWLGFLDELSRGHACNSGRAMTVVVTADDLRPWRSKARKFACLGGQRLTVLGDWAAVESSRDPAVRELLDAGM